MSSKSSLATSVIAARTGGICNAELAGVEEKRIRVCNIELFFLFHQSLSFGGECLEQAFPQRGHHMFTLFGRQVQTKVTLVLKSLEASVVVVLGL